MITITIVAFIVAIALPRIAGHTNQTKAIIRKLSTLSRELRFRAKLENATYRIVFDMEEDDKGNPLDSYWVEKGHGSILNNYNPESPPKNPADEARARKEAKDHDEKLPPPQFTIDRSITQKHVVFPSQLILKSVELSTLDEPVTKGVVYIHFLPSGFSDEAAVHLNYGKIRWTLVTQPLTGRMVILTENKSLKDIEELQKR